MNVYERLGVSPIINAAGTLTRLGGTMMLPEVRDAMSEAANALVPIDQLQAVATRLIAEACGSEAGYVTSGAAAGLTLATAACMVGLDIVKMDRLPSTEGMRNEVIICRPHRNSYDHAYRAAGAKLVEVGMSDRSTGAGVRETEIWEIEAAISDRTAAIAYTAGVYSDPDLKAVCAMAKRRGIPVIVDAAAELPPPSNLRRFIADGADLVSFSGGKAIRGPQGTGILAGRRDLIASVALQQLDMDVTFDLWTPPPALIPKDQLIGAPRHGIGRGYKVSKEQIIGLLVALPRFTEDAVQHDFERWVAILDTVEHGLRGRDGVRCTLVAPHFELGIPVLEIHIDERRTGKDAFAIAAALKEGKPPVYVGERKLMDGSLMIHPFNLGDAAAAVVLERLLEAMAPTPPAPAGALPRVTYVNAGEDFTALHAYFDTVLAKVDGMLGRRHPNLIGGPDLEGSLYVARSPIDRDIVLGEFCAPAAGAVARTVKCARDAFAGWNALGWERRVSILQRVADEVEKRKYELAAALILEVGKSRMEALGEAEEAIDLIRYYCAQMAENQGFERPLARARANESTLSVQRPYGVFAVIAPFNFPVALSAGMLSAALVAGNTAVYKPSPMGGLTASMLVECFVEGGVPVNALCLLCGGDETGKAIVASTGIDGVAFTGSHNAGMEIFRSVNATGFARPVLAEMGGKNPSYVTASADLATAASGVARSAFGLQGQKCSANSVTYVQRSVANRFVEALVAQTSALAIGDPRQRDVFIGPLIDDAARGRWQRAVDAGQKSGSLVHGGHVLSGGLFDKGAYVEPTIIELPDPSHWINKHEIFAPLLSVVVFDRLEDAIDEGNRAPYGLTAGVYATDERELTYFLEHAHAGALYANRASGSTTGAWPGIQTFCGWKGSGITGKGGLGPWYVPQFMREQSQTVMR